MPGRYFQPSRAVLPFLQMSRGCEEKLRAQGLWGSAGGPRELLLSLSLPLKNLL